MNRNGLIRLGLLATTVVATVATAIIGSGQTGAYFSDTKNGTVSGTVGTVKVVVNGGTGADNADLKFTELLPGEPQSVSGTFKNTGSTTQDVWLKFPNATALSALNNLGTYGEFHIVANGTEIFASTNLNDRAATCGAFSTTGCWPIPTQIKLASNVGVGNTGNFKLTFAYASKLKTQPNDGVWNVYPVPAGQYSASNTDGQTTVNAGDGSGNGLPYQIVAVQKGQQP